MIIFQQMMVCMNSENNWHLDAAAVVYLVNSY